MPEQIPLGFTFSGVAAGIKKTGAADLALIASDRPCSAAAVFTRNAFPAAPVLYDRGLVAENPAGLRAVAINAGCANACTGDTGLADAAEMAALTERALGLPPRSAAVMSTGVIGPRLPMARIAAGVEAAAAALSAEGWDAASRAIMTTDTRPKVAFREVGGHGHDAAGHDAGGHGHDAGGHGHDASGHGHDAGGHDAGGHDAGGHGHDAGGHGGPLRLMGMCKGAGMIHPDMATMLAVIVTDAAVEPAVLQAMLRQAVDVSFNAISVDGDTSTNDTVLLLANGAAGVPVPGTSEVPGTFAAALTALCTDLAQQIVRDGEGATKFITVRVEGAASDADARRAAKAVANSPLVKTAFYGGDANWGRILAAVGYSGAAVAPGKAELWIAAGAEGQGDAGTRGQEEALQLVRGGQPLAYSEEAASAIFAGPEITVTVRLGLGAGQATVWTCDLSHEYVSINGHYRT